MFWERLVSGIILLAVTIFVVAYGGNVLLFALEVISIVGMFEFYRTSKQQSSVLAGIAYAVVTVFYAFLYMRASVDFGMLLMVGMLCLMAWYVIAYPKYQIEQVTAAFFGIVYVAMTLSCIYHVRVLSDGVYLVWLIFIGAWGSDTCAYCVGKLIGKHKLPSRLSPNKSIEGCVGGIAGAALIGFLYGSIFQKNFSAVAYPAFVLAFIGAASSVISQIGDLAASAIKRNHNIKDYGHLIPGHGGILDRFDSIIFTAPLVYILAKFFV